MESVYKEVKLFLYFEKGKISPPFVFKVYMVKYCLGKTTITITGV